MKALLLLLLCAAVNAEEKTNSNPSGFHFEYLPAVGPPSWKMVFDRDIIQVTPDYTTNWTSVVVTNLTSRFSEPMTNIWLPSNPKYQICFDFGGPITLLSFSTNRFTNQLSLLNVYPDTNLCAVCGLAHHELHVVHVTASDTVWLTTSFGGQTRSNIVFQGPAHEWVQTNIVARTQTRRQPGFTSPPPLP